MSDNDWEGLGAVAPEELADARLVAHWALQIVAAASTRLPARADFSHTSVSWSSEHRALMTEPIDGVRAGLRIHDLTVVVVGGGDGVHHSLAGETLKAGLAWLQATLDERLGSPVELVLPAHDMPTHSVGDGSPFPDAAHEAYAELARWFANAQRIVSEVATERKGAQARCWPHHFDLATLITIVANEDAEKARTVGVGLSPGDGGYAQPYWYVTPWPWPAADALSELEVGTWHTDGWTGAVLTASALLKHADQPAALHTFLASAVESSIRLVS